MGANQGMIIYESTPVRARNFNRPGGSPEQVSQGKRCDCDDEHHAGGHEFFRFRQPQGEDHHQGQQKNVGKIACEARLENAAQQSQRQQDGENRGHDQRHFAFALKKTDHPADQQEDDIDPENLCRKIIHARQIALIRDDLQAQNLARLAFRNDLKRTAAHFTIGGETLGGNAGVHGDLKTLAAKRALDGLGNFDAFSLTKIRCRFNVKFTANCIYSSAFGRFFPPSY
jgi:hypothetical protein